MRIISWVGGEDWVLVKQLILHTFDIIVKK
jgi:hypothetical protein